MQRQRNIEGTRMRESLLQLLDRPIPGGVQCSTYMLSPGMKLHCEKSWSTSNNWIMDRIACRSEAKVQ
jgi:hypothetical protein